MQVSEGKRLCPKCNNIYTDDMFYNNSSRKGGGKSAYCKFCDRENGRKWEQNNIEKKREMRRRYHAKKCATDPTFIERENKRKYEQMDLEKRKEYFFNYKRNNKDKVNAGSRLWRAIRDGKIIRPKECPLCGENKKRIIAHHDDYSQPLEVKFMCHRCHSILHNKR